MNRADIFRKAVRFLTVLGGASGILMVFMRLYEIENVEVWVLNLGLGSLIFINCGYLEGSTKVFNTNRQFLEQVKREFKISYNVLLRKRGGKDVHYSVQGREYIGDLKDKWYLSLGAEIFNKMMESVRKSMERKRKYYPLSTDKYAYENLKKLIKNKLNLETIIHIAPITVLSK